MPQYQIGKNCVHIENITPSPTSNRKDFIYLLFLCQSKEELYNETFLWLFFFYEILHGTILSVQYFLFLLLIRYLPIRSTHQTKRRILSLEKLKSRPFFLAIIRSRSNAETEYCAMASTTSQVTEIGKKENLYCMKLYHVSQRPISWRIGSGYILICKTKTKI